MEEKKPNLTFDDLFEDKPIITPTFEVNEYSKGRGWLIIASYFLIFILIASLIQLILIAIPNMTESYNSTEAVVRYVEKNDSISYTSLTAYEALENKDRVYAHEMGEYVLLMTKGLFEEEVIDEDYVKNAFSGSEFSVGDKPIKRVENVPIEGFFDTTFKPTYDVSFRDYFNLTIEASTLANFLVYFVAGVSLVWLSFGVLKKDYLQLNRRPLAILSMIGIGYLFILGSNIIGNTLSSILSTLLNYSSETSVNQELINQTLTSKLAPLMIIATIIGAPIVEELIFRKGFFSIIKNKWVALVVSSLIFGLMHVIGEVSFAGFIINLVIYSSSGAAFGLIYIYNKKNIYAPIFVHALSNFIAVMLFYFFPGLI